MSDDTLRAAFAALRTRDQEAEQRKNVAAYTAQRKQSEGRSAERKRAFTVGAPAAFNRAKDWLTKPGKADSEYPLYESLMGVGDLASGAYNMLVDPVLKAGAQLRHGRGPIVEGARFAVSNPREAAANVAGLVADLTPGVGSAKAFKDITDQAAEFRAAGDNETADMLSEMAVPMALGVLATDGTGALALKAAGKGGARMVAKPAAERAVYNRATEGPFTVVSRQGANIQRAPEAAHARTMGELRTIAQDPARSPAIPIANEASMRSRGVPYDASAPAPISSLGRQGAVGRAYEEAVAGSPAYKHAAFERWGEMYPQIVEKAKAQNLDQLTEASYNALGDDVARQFDRLPVTTKYHSGEGEYGSPNDMMRDVLANGNLNVFSGGDPHEFLSKIDPATGLSQNEMFRAVHDYMGHVVPGSQFGPAGEEVAYAAHAQTLDPLSLPALLSETRGQNSWVNYSPTNADLIDQMNRIKMQNRERVIAQQFLGDSSPRYSNAARAGLDALPSASEARAALHELGSRYQYAPQRAVTLPPEFLDPYAAGGQPEWMRQVMQTRAPTNDVRGVHFSRAEGLSELDPSYYGTGAFSGERRMVVREGLPRRTYFYSGPEGTVRPEDTVGRVGQHVYEAKLGNLYDVNADPEGLVKLARAYNLPDYQPTLDEHLAYLSGAEGKSLLPDMERLIRDYGYDGFLSDMGGQHAAALYKPVTGLRRIAPGLNGYAEGGLVS